MCFFIHICAQSRTVFYPYLCIEQNCLLSIFVHRAELSFIHICVQSRTVFYPYLCIEQNCFLSIFVHRAELSFNRICVTNRTVFYPYLCIEQNFLLSIFVYRAELFFFIYICVQSIIINLNNQPAMRSRGRLITRYVFGI